MKSAELGARPEPGCCENIPERSLSDGRFAGPAGTFAGTMAPSVRGREKTLNDATRQAESRIVFLFKGGRRARLEGASAAERVQPREFFYGFTELEAAGLAARLIEEVDLGGGTEGLLSRAATPLTHAAAGINVGLLTRLGSSQSLAQLNRFEIVVATTNNQGMALALLRRLGRLKARVLFIPMGVLPAGASPLRRAVTRRLLRGITLAPLSRAEEGYLVDALGPGHDVAYLPFGVDDRFWTPQPEGASDGGYVLSIGNDWRRDYATLAAAWRPEYPPLKIVTRLPVPASDGTVEVVAGDWNRQILSDAEVRELFRGALFVVLPLTDTIQPSGQSACLQAMACGKAVVISDIAGLFDRGALADGETCVLAPPGSVADLGNRIEGLLGDGGRAQAIGRRARKAVEEHFTIDIMAAGLKQRLESLLAVGPPP